MNPATPTVKLLTLQAPVVASYVVDFLKPEMLHVYRQIANQTQVRAWVLTHKRENAEAFPFPEKRIEVLEKSKLRGWRRFLHRHFIRAPWQLYRHELYPILLTLKRIDAQLLHIYFGHMAVHWRPILRTFPGPVVVSYHGADAGIDTQRPEYLAAMREVFAYASQIQARSESLAKDLILLGCPEEKIHIQRTGIPLEQWTFTERVYPEHGAWQLLQSCRLIDKKGLDDSLYAFAHFLKSYPNAKFHIAGEGPLLKELEQLCVTLQIQHSVRFLGFLTQDELKKEVESSHFFLHPSRTSKDGNREGVPNSMLEAMASGCPVIASHHGGIPEAIEHLKSGWLVAENDRQGLETALHEMTLDFSKSLQIAQHARTVIETRFNRSKNLQILEENYLKLIKAYR